MTSAANLSPFRIWSMNEIGKISKSADQRNRKPTASRFCQTGLLFHIVRKMRKRITLSQTAFITDFFISSGEGNGLECDEGDLLWIRSREFNNRSDLID